MRISHLIAELQKALAEHGDVAVITEGCDCTGDSHRVAFHPKSVHWAAYVEICRPDSAPEREEKEAAGLEYDNFAHEWVKRK